MPTIKFQIDKLEAEIEALVMDFDELEIGTQKERDRLARDGDDLIHYARTLNKREYE